MDSTSEVFQLSDSVGVHTPDFGTSNLLDNQVTHPSLPDASDYGFAPADQLLGDSDAVSSGDSIHMFDTVFGADAPASPGGSGNDKQAPTTISDVSYNGKNYTVTADPTTKRVQIFEQHPDGSLTAAEDLERGEREAILDLAKDKNLRDKAAAFLQNAQITPEEKENLAKLASLADKFDADVFAQVVESYDGRPEELQRLIKLANADAIVNDRNIRFEAKYDEVMDDVTVALMQEGYGAYEENSAPGPINVI